jgi:hypothetical protein
MAGGKASAKKIELAIRRNYVLSLRRQGGDWREIADTLRATLDTDEPVPGVTEKYSHVHAWQDGMAELKRLAEENAALAEYERDQQLDQLRELWAKFYPMAVDRGDYLAFDRCMTILDRRQKLLNIDTPQKVALTDPTGQKEYGAGLTADERLALLREAFGGLVPHAPGEGDGGAPPTDAA